MAPDPFEFPLGVPRIGQDHHRAGRVPDDVPAGRTDEGVVDGAVAVAAENQQFRVDRGVTEPLAGPPLDGQALRLGRIVEPGQGFVHDPVQHLFGMLLGLFRTR
jgi:hypothetical protein